MGAISRTPGVPVRFRGAPSLAGMVKISPRASTTTRDAVGERSSRPTTAGVTSLKCGARVSIAASGRSAASGVPSGADSSASRPSGRSSSR